MRNLSAALQRQSWPGNIRELRNFIRRVLTLSDFTEIGPELLTSELSSSAAVGMAVAASASVTPGTSIREVERHLLENALGMTGGNRTRAAEMLGVSVRTIRNKIRQYGLPPRGATHERHSNANDELSGARSGCDCAAPPAGRDQHGQRRYAGISNEGPGFSQRVGTGCRCRAAKAVRRWRTTCQDS